MPCTPQKSRLVPTRATLYQHAHQSPSPLVQLICAGTGNCNGELLHAHKRRKIEFLAQLLAQDIPASELLSLICNSETGRGFDFDFRLFSAEFQLQACRDKTFAKTYGKLHRTRRDTMAGLVTRLFAKLDRIPPSDPKDLADINMELTTGLFLQGTSMQRPIRRGFLSEAILLVLGLDRLQT